MSIDLHDPSVATRKAAKRARKRAVATVDAARAVDLHVPAEAAKTVARRAARKAAKRATVAANHAARRPAKRTGHRLTRVVLGLLAVGGLVGVAVVLSRRMRATPPVPAYVPRAAPEPAADPLETAEA